MEVYSRSSWFLLLFGLTLIAVTLQENTDCPIIDQVPCTSGTKCNSNEDCKNTEICCPNSCYTKRCVSKSKDGEGPSESDCRPYIEKALKELEAGEIQDIQTENDNDDDNNNDNVEDLPTIEITEDSSHQDDVVDNDDQATDIKVENIEVASREENEAVEDVDDLKQADTQSEHQIDIDDEANNIPTIINEQVQRTIRETEPLKQNDVSVEEQSIDDHESDETPAQPVEETEHVSGETVQEEILLKSAEETVQTKPVITRDVSKEEVPVSDKSEDTGCPTPQEVTNALGDFCHKHRNCGEGHICCSDKHYRKRCVAGSVPLEELEAESASSEESKETTKPEETTTDVNGCPPSSGIPCVGGVPCNKHKQCNEDEICCTNKCYRKRCVVGTVSSAELAEEGSDESTASEEKKTAPIENTAESTQEGGCPPSNTVSCIEGKLCSKHKHCDEQEICCPNKCYRKRCVTGTVSSAELAEEESDEELPVVSEISETSKGDKQGNQPTESGCPSPKEIGCVGGTWCSKHKHCGEDSICCPNKCYRKQCVVGQATSAELAEEADSEEELESKLPATIETKSKTEQSAETGCPNQNLVSCTEGELCTKHKECSESKICCPNKCYRKRCVPGIATEAELEAEQSDEVSKEVETEKEPIEVKKDSGCPDRNELACDAGEKCVKTKQCGDNHICCTNRCYRKVCIKGTPGSQELDESSEEVEGEQKDEHTKSQEVVDAAIQDDGCPLPSKVSCKEGEKCGDDDDCDHDEICCSNTCYTKRCVPGTKRDKSASHDKSDEQQSVEIPEELPKKILIKAIDISDEIEREPEPIKKPEVPPKKPLVTVTPKAPEPQIKHIEREEPSKPIKVLEDIYEDEKSLEKDDKDLVEELSSDDIPVEKKSRDHVEQLLKLDVASSKIENVQNRIYEETLKELKKVYDTAIKPLEMLYKYRDLSNRHFGDAEIFSKPLILFMGPWSGGKSSIINYLINNEYNETALRTGAEPSPAYFNILLHGNEPEIIDGAELAADFTFSGLQKFGQGLEQRLRGIKLNAKLLEKINIVEIPGILEVRKQVSRIFPFNDACQWFIDRADIIFLVYDPAKLDVGPETEAILDQLKGREHQTRIILNKADLVRPEELLRVQGALIWNISPLMSSPQPPIMYTTSLWSKPFEPWAPTRLLHAQERAFLRDLRSAILRRVENKIASARRFAVRVRNHAKMVDCYLTTYYNHKSVFGNRKQVANEIIEHPQNYHIYEGLSTLTNISRYDLPDPDVYKDFFKLNPLYEFQQLSATCTYFRGCPINRLDIAIAYDLPELVGRYKRNLEEAIIAANNPEIVPSPKPVKSTPRS